MDAGDAGTRSPQKKNYFRRRDAHILSWTPRSNVFALTNSCIDIGSKHLLTQKGYFAYFEALHEPPFAACCWQKNLFFMANEIMIGGIIGGVLGGAICCVCLICTGKISCWHSSNLYARQLPLCVCTHQNQIPFCWVCVWCNARCPYTEGLLLGTNYQWLSIFYPL